MSFNVFSLCEELLEKHSWGLGVIAFDWAYRVKEQYREDTSRFLKRLRHGQKMKTFGFAVHLR